MIDSSIIEEFQLEECCQYIIRNNFRRVVLQLRKQQLTHSIQIVNYIQNSVECQKGDSEANHSIDLYVTQSNTCCLDLLVTQHVSDVDAIIHFGNLCLSLPNVESTHLNKPILCIFQHQARKNAKTIESVNKIKLHVQSLLETGMKSYCIFYDTSCIDFAIYLKECLQDLVEVDLAKLYRPSNSWETTAIHSSFFIDRANTAIGNSPTGFFNLPKSSRTYDCALYIGSTPQLGLILGGPAKFFRINPSNEDVLNEIDVKKLLRRRVATIERIKDYEDLRIGVIITNPLPLVKEKMDKFERISQYKRHTLYFVSMIQTIDEFKIGNFDLCDAFIVINSCHCSTILESLYFNRPILTEVEFQIVCGLETEYGGIVWSGMRNPSNSLSGADLSNQRIMSDVSVAMMHTSNELLERCNQANLNRWSGLDYDTNNEQSDLDIEAGLKGIASCYSNEPFDSSKKD